MINNGMKVENISQNNLWKIIKGSIIAVLTSLVLLLVFAILLAYTSVSEKIIPQTIIAISVISILIGSLISSMKIKKQGILNGGAVGGIYIVSLYLLSSIVQSDFGLNAYAFVMIVASVLARMFWRCFGCKY